VRRRIWQLLPHLGVWACASAGGGLTVRVESPQDNLFEDDSHKTGASPQILQEIGSNQMNSVMNTERGNRGGSYDEARRENFESVFVRGEILKIKSPVLSSRAPPRP
jgi:hypothetical protein